MSTRLTIVLTLLVIIFTESHGTYYNICKIGSKYRRPNCENIYVWDKQLEQFISLLNDTLNQDRIDFSTIRGETVRVLADNMLPYVTSSNLSHDLGGLLGDIWQIMEQYFQFRSNISSVEYEVGLEIVASGTADVLLAAVVPNFRLFNVQYSQPYLYNWFHLFMKRPEPRASSALYLRIFHTKLWLITLTVFALLTISVWMTIRFLNSIHRIEPCISLPSCFLGIISGFINQGFDLKLRSHSGRIQVMFALILGVILYSAMNAVLVAQLTVFDMPFPFRSIKDIVDKRTHSLCLRSNSFVYNNFTDENREILPNWKEILNGRHCLDINNQTNLKIIVCKDNLVIMESRVVMDAVFKHYNLQCHLVNHPDRFFIKGNSFLMRKNFKYKKLLNWMLERIYMTGILERLENQWILRDKFVDLNQVGIPQVTLDHTAGILTFYASMILISCLILFCEILYNRFTISKRPVHNIQFCN